MITINNLNANLHQNNQLLIHNLSIKAGDSWAFIGSNGSGKSALASLFSGRLSADDSPNYSDKIKGLKDLTIAVVSFEEQQRLIDQEHERDESDLTNEVFEGTPVIDLFLEISQDKKSIEKWTKAFNVQGLLKTGFRKLSTGESRKIILIRALLQTADLLVFDEPFDGLDAQSQSNLKDTLEQLHANGQSLILILNRLDEVPNWVSHMGFLHNCQLIAQGSKHLVLQDETVKAFLTFNAETLQLPDCDPCAPKLKLDPQQPLVKLNNGKVAYCEKLIFKDLNWTIKQGEHWSVLGPNGCGKSTLLNLISGDHPQCYANDLTVFGIKRGSGESIWDIKQHIGIISAALQWQYKTGTNVISTVISGLFDSIGLYTQVEDHQKELALNWLKQVNLEHQANTPLHQLSYGEQRLVLICRAMIKQPALLILDEPCQGLDDPNRQLVLGFINMLAQQKATTLLYVTHHKSDLMPCFTKSLVCYDVNPESGSLWRI
jgi:molybdate transport system ATP-binding protein